MFQIGDLVRFSDATMHGVQGPGCLRLWLGNDALYGWSMMRVTDGLRFSVRSPADYALVASVADVVESGIET